MRLLLVEDDEMIAETVLDAMRRLGYAIDWAADGRAADLSLGNGVYDLVLLDLGLQKRDGMQVLNTYRKAGGAASVIILTAHDTVDGRIRGLDAGADDYLMKPFDLDELAARVRAALRRRTGQKQPVYTHGELALDPASHEASKGGVPLQLMPPEFALLQVLIEEPTRVFKARGTRGEVAWMGRRSGQQYYRSACPQSQAQDWRGADIDDPGCGLPAQANRMIFIRCWLLGWLIFRLAATLLEAAHGIVHIARREATK